MVAVNIKINRYGAIVVGFFGLILLFYGLGGPSLFQSDQKVSLKNLLCVGIDLARAGGDKVRLIHETNAKDIESKGLTDEGKKDLISEGDKQSHRTMYYGFEKAFPGIMVRSEEHDIGPIHLSRISEPSASCPEVDERISSDHWVPLRDVTVWIDPLDATQEYTENLTEYVTVMACIVVNNRPLGGVIHRPFFGDTHWALVGFGASFSNDAERRNELPPPSPNRPDYNFIISRSHSSSKTRQLLETAYGNGASESSLKKDESTSKKSFKIVEAGGAGYKALAVINGSYDAYVHWSIIKMWDVCAADALITYAGGQATDMEGNLIQYDVRGDAKIKKGFLLAKRKHSDYLATLGEAIENIKKQQQSVPGLQNR